MEYIELIAAFIAAGLFLGSLCAIVHHGVDYGSGCGNVGEEE